MQQTELINDKDWSPSLAIRDEYYRHTIESDRLNGRLITTGMNSFVKKVARSASIFNQNRKQRILSQLSRSVTTIHQKRKNSAVDSCLTLKSTNHISICSSNPSIHEIQYDNPSLLSHLAESFKQSIILNTRIKDSIEYKDVFTGTEAIDKIISLININDRDLALSLGRSLEDQKLFHDVYYENQLIDSNSELYQLRQTTEENEIQGVFTLLGTCYSYSCTKDNTCYSPTCQQQQQKKAKSSLSEPTQIKDRLWIHTVPKLLLDTLTHKEINRQENLFELIYTETDFIHDLTYLKTEWIDPLLDQYHQTELVQDIFWNVLQVLDLNRQLLTKLLERQAQQNRIDQIGDLFQQHSFEPFVTYGAHQSIGRYRLEREKNSNRWFSEFVQRTERLPQSRKLELNGYLTKPTTRLGRYNLLLREILKHTPPDHPDTIFIPQSMALIEQFLKDVNTETGKSDNALNLKILCDQLLNKNMSNFDLDLDSPDRQLIMKGTLKKGLGLESSEYLIYLLDHCLLIMKSKQNEKLKLYKKPIPLILLSVSFPDDIKKNTITLNKDILNKNGYPISFIHLGKQNSFTTLYTTSLMIRTQWARKIEEQKKVVEKNKAFDLDILNATFFSHLNKVNCATVFDHGKSFLFGSDQGVYLLKENERLSRVLDIEKVSQLEMLDEWVMVLADKNLYAYSLESILLTDGPRRPITKVGQPVSFFKVGQVTDKKRSTDRTLVCYVRHTATISTIRALEPHKPHEKRKEKKKRILFWKAHPEILKVYRDLYIPGQASSVQFFKNSICVGSERGFEMVDLGSLEVQSALDPTDPHLFHPLEDLKPMAMFRHLNGNLLLCYNQLAFYIDKKGRRVFQDWCIYWEGSPIAFAFKPPYVIAFNSNFIEIRNIDTGNLVQVIPGNNIRSLCPDSTDRIFGVMEGQIPGSEIIFELNLVDPS